MAELSPCYRLFIELRDQYKKITSSEQFMYRTFKSGGIMNEKV